MLVDALEQAQRTEDAQRQATSDAQTKQDNYFKNLKNSMWLESELRKREREREKAKAEEKLTPGSLDLSGLPPGAQVTGGHYRTPNGSSISFDVPGSSPAIVPSAAPPSTPSPITEPALPEAGGQLENELFGGSTTPLDDAPPKVDVLLESLTPTARRLVISHDAIVGKMQTRGLSGAQRNDLHLQAKSLRARLKDFGIGEDVLSARANPAQPTPQTQAISPTPAPPMPADQAETTEATGEFIEGKTYEDAEGNRARFTNGQFQPIN